MVEVRVNRLAAALLGLLAATPCFAAPKPAQRPPLSTQPISLMTVPWWHARHEAKLAEARRSPVDLVFLGDSITQDYEKSGPPAWQDFVPVWQHFYGDRHSLNLGFSGDATSHLLWRMEHGEVDGMSPKVAIILIGANGLGRLHWSAEENVRGIEAVVAETRRKLPTTKILLLGVLPSERSAYATETTREINQSLAAEYGNHAVPSVTFVDASAVFLHHGVIDQSLFLDPLLTPPAPPLHPSAEGQARLATAIEPTLASLLGDRDHTR